MFGVDEKMAPDRFHAVERAIAAEFDITVEMLRYKTRKVEIARARQMVWFLAKDALGYSPTRIARIHGKDHTTVIHGIDKIIELDLVERAYEIFNRREPEVAKTVPPIEGRKRA